jgi:hypothetical protein
MYKLQLLLLNFLLESNSKNKKLIGSTIIGGTLLTILYKKNKITNTCENNLEINKTDTIEKMEEKINININNLIENFKSLETSNKSTQKKILKDFIYSTQHSMNRKVANINGMLGLLNITGDINKENNKYIYTYIFLNDDNYLKNPLLNIIISNIRDLNYNMQKLLDKLLDENLIKISKNIDNSLKYEIV